MSSLATVDIYQKKDQDAIDVEKRELIDLFQNAYGDGGDPRPPNTKTQGLVTDVIKGKKRLQAEYISFFVELSAYTNNATKEGFCLPFIIDIEDVVTGMREEYKSRGYVLSMLKILYCYNTGALLIEPNKNGCVYVREIKSKNIMTGKFSRAQIEHIIAWRQMQTNAAGLPESTSGFVSGLRDVIGTGVDTNELIKTVEGKAKLKEFGELIASLGQDPFAFTSVYPYLKGNVVFADMLKANPSEALKLLINMERIRWHGMWYSIRLFNQIKTNCALFKIIRHSDGKLEYKTSPTIIRMMVEMMMCNILKENGELYENFEEYENDKENIKHRMQNFIDKAEIKKEKIIDDGSVYHYDGNTPNRSTFDNEGEFDYFKKIITTLQKEGNDYKKIVERLEANTNYVMDYLCEQLNSYKYERVKVMNARVLPDAKGVRGNTQKKGIDVSRKSGMLDTPENSQTIKERSYTNKKQKHKGRKLTDSIKGSKSPDTKKKPPEGGRKRTRRRRKRKRKRTRRKKRKKKRSKKKRRRRKRTRRRR